MKRRKPAEDRKDEMVRIRMKMKTKNMLVEAAESDGLDLSSWLRMLGVREAKKKGLTEE